MSRDPAWNLDEAKISKIFGSFLQIGSWSGLKSTVFSNCLFRNLVATSRSGCTLFMHLSGMANHENTTHTSLPLRILGRTHMRMRPWRSRITAGSLIIPNSGFGKNFSNDALDADVSPCSSMVCLMDSA